ncbi:MAG TPA: VOC family protein, partial [Pseudodesulfovibrio sp.]|nr:VOC family protein [Pseudodesulfovibrio sp.]
MKRIVTTLWVGSVLGLTALAAPEEFASPTISIGVIVSNLEKSVDFYTRVVGMTKSGEFDVDGT